MREGIAAQADQRTAGGLMMTLDIVMMAVAVSWFFWLASREHDASGAYRLGPPGRDEPPPGGDPAPQPRPPEPDASAAEPQARSRAAI